MAATPVSCTSCGALIAEGAAFCPACGARQEPPATCQSCGALVKLGARFCPSCGASTAPEALPHPPVPAACSSCGSELAPDARFCAACGAKASQAVARVEAPAVAPAAPVAEVCGSCGNALKHGARFCGKCGTPQLPSAVESPAPRTPQQAAAPHRADPFGSRAAPRPSARRVPPPATPASATGGKALTWRDLVLGGGLAAAFLSVFFDWISSGPFGAGPLDADARFRIGDWLSTDKLDGYLVLLLAAAGLAAMVLARLGRAGGPWQRLLPNVPMVAGSLLTAIAVIEYQFITSKWKELDVDVAFGVYLLLLGGVAAAVSRFVPNQRIGQAPG